MPEALSFPPPRRTGIAFQAIVATLLTTASGLALIRMLEASRDPTILGYLAIVILMALPLPLVVYRFYALIRSSYMIEREGLRLRWGLRSEDLPMPNVLWVRPASELGRSLPLPYLRWPGSIVGVRRQKDLGPIEFMASDLRKLILIATPSRLFAISPADPTAFLQAFHHQTEMGSLAPLAPQSQQPTLLLQRVWTDLSARYLLLSGALFSLGILVWVALIVSQQASIPLGFTPSGEPRNPVSSVRLSLLPVINSFFFIIDVMLGLFLYRRPESRPLAYILWITAVVTSLLFLGAMYLILQSG